MSIKQEFLLTADGYTKIENELNELKINKRPEVIKALKEARALGDLSENADYDAARNDQSMLEAQIKKLENMIANAKIIKNNETGLVNIGSTVTISYVDDNDEEVFPIFSL